MKTILVTGSKGQLGRKMQDAQQQFKQFNFLFKDVDDLDITSATDIESFFEDNKIDAVVNCAAYTNVDKAEDEFPQACLVNEKGPKLLAQVCDKYSIIFIHISTDYVFAGNENKPYEESFKTSPISNYGISKLKGEEAVIKATNKSIIIRTSWLYSEYQKNFALTILRLAKENNQLKVVNDQFGTPTYAGDLANAILQILTNCFININKVQEYSGIYHYSNLGVCSWYDFAVYILKQSGIKTTIIPVDTSEFKTKAQRPKYSVLNKAKIINTFKIKVPYWTDSCKIMLNKI